MEELNRLIKPIPTALDRACIWLAGVDGDTLALCPQRDFDCVRAIAFLMIVVWMYQTFLFSIVFHRMLATDGSIHPEFIAIAAFIATMVLLIDSFMVMRSGWHLHGIEELKRGGLDISGGWGPRGRNGIFLAIRILLSLGVAQLCAIFVALILFSSDIGAKLDLDYRSQNAALISRAEANADATIADARKAVDAQSARVAQVDAQLATTRQGTIDPASTDAGISDARAEVTRLEAQKTAADAELAAAQLFAANEIGGIKGDPGNSGKPGKGPVRQAAEERVAAAQAAETEATQSLSDARARLDNLTKQFSAGSESRTKLAVGQLPELQTQADAETARLGTLRARLDQLTAGRESAIRSEVDGAADHARYDNGLLGQLGALKTLASDPEIASVIVLIDVTSFGLELAAVLAKVTSFIPSTFSALLARDAYMKAVRIVGEMDEELNGGGGAEESDAISGSLLSDDFGADSDADPSAERSTENGLVPPLSPDETVPPKRPRGRPRKSQT